MATTWRNLELRSGGWIHERLEALIPQLEPLTVEDEDRARELIHAEIEDWNDRGLSKNTQRNCHTDYKKAIATIPLTDDNSWVNPYNGESCHIAYKPLNEYWKELIQKHKINDPSRSAVSQRQRHQVLLSKQQVDRYLEMTETLLASEDWVELTVGILAATGRRLTEVLKTATFVVKNDCSLWFSGQLKGEIAHIPYEIPTLVRADKVTAALSKLRQLHPCLDSTKKDFSSESLDIKARLNALDLIPPKSNKEQVTAHDLRGVYLRLAIFFYCPLSVDENLFSDYAAGHWSLVLPHTIERHAGSNENYRDYQVAPDAIAAAKGYNKGSRLDDANVEIVDYFRLGHLTFPDVNVNAIVSELLVSDRWQDIAVGFVAATGLMAPKMLAMGAVKQVGRRTLSHRYGETVGFADRAFIGTLAPTDDIISARDRFWSVKPHGVEVPRGDDWGTLKDAIEATVRQRFAMARLSSLDDLVRHYSENAPEPEPEPTRTLEVPESVWERYQHLLVSLGVDRGGNESDRFATAITYLMELEQALKSSGVQYLSDFTPSAAAENITTGDNGNGNDRGQTDLQTTIAMTVQTAIAPLQQRLDLLEFRIQNSEFRINSTHSAESSHTQAESSPTLNSELTTLNSGDSELEEEWERFTAMSYLELKGFRQSDAATVRLLKATEAVKQYNLHCPEASGRWFLNPSQLNRLTGAEYNAAKGFMASHETLVNEINTAAMEGFNGSDRALNRKGYTISEAIPEPTIDFLLDDAEFWTSALYTRASSGKWNSPIPLKDGGQALIQSDRTSVWDKDGELTFEAKLTMNDKGNYSTWSMTAI